MDKNKINSRFEGTMNNTLKYISQGILLGIAAQIVEGTKFIFESIDRRVIKTERKILNNLYLFLLMGFAGVFLILAFFSYLKEFVGLSDTMAYLIMGVIILLVGLLIKKGVLKGGENEK